ncbi:FAD/NAD(P)-binding domain-containing protein [Trematosphaeria pertusa]|uniref:FAD/NAD(P)-binding domain-containing protein n=1 Tax=Trematosphaeria pertusa TaxID=390896 RepID=A0A6A6J4F8_9PLEO|nr:FAD/NAD(P)-binding domain-containing protein [Trematosphaeria pertusa]KAF2257102.1 FAD/NAD(P)-binding domain-containing protein [Trematosphaeria pertusa]
MSTETILVLGGSFAGLNAAHYALKHTIPQLPKKDGTTYTVTMVNPSKDFFWRIAGPRACVSKKLMPPSKLFYPIEPAFAYAKDNFTFIQGTATHVDPAGQTVSVTTVSGEQKQIPYLALIIATGISTPSPLFTQTTNAADLEATYDAFQKQLPNAKTVVIGGGGPVGVETAGEIAEFLNGKPGWLAAAPKNPKAQVTLVTADKKMLPLLRESISKQAEKFLKRLGCDVVYNTKVVSTTTTGEGEGAKTAVQLSDGKTMEADIYIDATGVRPNSSFLPKEWLDNRNRVDCNPKTLRVEHESAGPRVYVMGDVGSYTRGGVVDMYDAIPVAMTNLKTDLIAHISGKEPGPDRHYTPNLKEQQICPIGTQKGVGAFAGRPVPSIMVWAIKGRDYLIGQLAEAQVRGDPVKKETKWKPQPIVASGKAGLSSGQTA